MSIPSMGKARIVCDGPGRFTVEADGKTIPHVEAFKLEGARDCLHELTLTLRVADVEVEGADEYVSVATHTAERLGDSTIGPMVNGIEMRD